MTAKSLADRRIFDAGFTNGIAYSAALILLLAALLLIAWHRSLPVPAAWHAPELTVSERAWYKERHVFHGIGGSVRDMTGDWFFNQKKERCKL